MKINKVIQAGMGYTIGNILIKGLSFLTIPIFTCLMSTSDYGLYTTFLSYEGILSLIIGFGLHASLKAAKIEYKDQIDYYVSAVLLLPIATTCILLLVAVGICLKSGQIAGFDLCFGLLLILNAFSSSVVMMYNSRISLDYQYKKFVLLSLIGAVLNIGLSILLIVSLSNSTSFFGRLMGTSIANITISLYMLWFFFRKRKLQIRCKYFREPLI